MNYGQECQVKMKKLKDRERWLKDDLRNREENYKKQQQQLQEECTNYRVKAGNASNYRKELWFTRTAFSYTEYYKDIHIGDRDRYNSAADALNTSSKNMEKEINKLQEDATNISKNIDNEIKILEQENNKAKQNMDQILKDIQHKTITSDELLNKQIEQLEQQKKSI